MRLRPAACTAHQLSVCLDRGAESLTRGSEHVTATPDLGSYWTLPTAGRKSGPGATARMGLDATSWPPRPAAHRLRRHRLRRNGAIGRNRKAYDLLCAGQGAGLLSVTEHGDQVARTGVSIADIAAGTFAYSGILTALLRARATTGQASGVGFAASRHYHAEWISQPAYYAHLRWHGAVTHRCAARDDSAVRAVHQAVGPCCCGPEQRECRASCATRCLKRRDSTETRL